MGLQLRGIALAAVLVVASSALIPVAHGGASHRDDCAVCDMIAHDTSSSADVALIQDLYSIISGTGLVVCEPEAAPPRLDVRLRPARAPPSNSVAA